MTYRMLRDKQGQWAEPMVEDAQFFDDGAAWARAVEQTLGLPANTLEVVDADTDLREAPAYVDPNVTPEPEAPEPSKIDVLIDLLSQDKSLAPETLSALQEISKG